MNTASLNSDRWWAYGQLMRPANIITAWADILVGFAVAGMVSSVENATNLMPLVGLLIATTGLYGGGVVFNDVFDAELDAQERPERPIPSGRTSRSEAIGLGSFLLVLGIMSAAFVSWESGAIALFVAAAALFYDGQGKHHPLIGSLNMGICRGGNLLLGMSILPSMIESRWFLALIPVMYIAAITAISRGEVQGGKTRTGIIALLLIWLVISSAIALGWMEDYRLLTALPFILFFIGRVLPPFIKAILNPNPEPIRAAVKAGVLSLIVLDAAIASGFGGLLWGLLVLSLLPLSLGLGKLFAVT